MVNMFLKNFQKEYVKTSSFQAVKEKMSPEILDKIKCELPENYQKLL